MSRTPDVIHHVAPDFERFLLRYVGGPLGGLTHQTTEPAEWPMPEVVRLVQPGMRSGHYHKRSESQLKERFEGVLRGVEYEWVIDD